jgi:phenylalanine-4-hydroxylase
MTKVTNDALLTDPRLPHNTQHPEQYTDQDLHVWKLLFERQYRHLPPVASKVYLDGLQALGLRSDRIPDFSEVDGILGEMTGWSVQRVLGLIDDDLFFGLLHHRRFPASTWLRNMESLDYLQEPDMFHDAFAHLPLLTNNAFAGFLKEMADIALVYLDHPFAIGLLSRIYWYTVEFGLIREQGQLRVYGAGIISSAGETQFSLSDEPKHLDYDVSLMLHTPYWKNKFQDRYFIIDSFDQLYASIPEISRQLEIELEKEGDDL